MNAVFILALLLLFLMIIFGGKKGFISYLTLFLNFAILIISIVLIILAYRFMSSHSFSALLLALVIYSYSIVTMLKHKLHLSALSLQQFC